MVLNKTLIIALPGVGTRYQQGGRPLGGAQGAHFARLCGVGDHATDLWEHFEIISLTPLSQPRIPRNHPQAAVLYRQAALPIRDRMIYTEPRDVIFLGSPVWRAFNMSFRIEYFEWVTWLGLHRAAKLPSPHSWSKFFERYPEAGRRMTRFMRKTVRDNGSPK